MYAKKIVKNILSCKSEKKIEVEKNAFIHSFVAWY